MRSFFLPLLIMVALHACAQTSLINESEVNRIEKTLASDDMQGRQVYTPGIEKAAAFICSEFKAAGLKPLPGSKDYRQVFSMEDPEPIAVSATLDGSSVEQQNIIVFTTDTFLRVSESDNYKKVFVKKGDDFNDVFHKYLDESENVLIFVDTSFSIKFARLQKRHVPQFSGSGNRIFVLTPDDPKRYDFRATQKIQVKALTNLVGMIPGKSKPDEYVIFSAHYDHLGMGKPNAAGDSVFNGANDDASGTTAIIMLAKYFAALHNNERTIIFAAFTAEEIGEFGSAYFGKKTDPEKVVAMFNIEMIGTESRWGKNSAYITGFDKSDMGEILQKNLVNSQFKFYPDPYPAQMLFLRSDNASLAKLGVPAHTISTSKMDSEKYYHTMGDEITTLDLDNMTEIIRAIALSSGSIVSGKDSPTRVVQ